MTQCLNFQLFCVLLSVLETASAAVSYCVDRCLGLQRAECGAKCVGVQLCYHLNQRVDQCLGLHITQCVDKCVIF